MAIAYPNLYFVGMSNLGFQGVFQLLRSHPEVLCERVFLPDDRSAEQLSRTGRSLGSFESGRGLRDFHVLAFSISFENDYLHVLRMLRMAGVPLRAEDRGPGDPVVVFGGSAMFLNPEPLAAFADGIGNVTPPLGDCCAIRIEEVLYHLRSLLTLIGTDGGFDQFHEHPFRMTIDRL